MKNPRLLHEEIYIYITQLRDQRCVYSSTLPIHGNSNAANSHVNFFTGHHANHAIPGAIHFGAPLAIYGRHNPTVDQAYLLVVISLSYKLYVLVHVLCEWLTALWSLELMQCTTVCWVPTLLSCPVERPRERAHARMEREEWRMHSWERQPSIPAHLG